MGVCNCSMFCCTLLYVHFSISIILMGKRELIALLNLSSWCLVVVERLFLAVPRGCLQFVIVVFPVHTHLLFFILFRCSEVKKRQFYHYKPNLNILTKALPKRAFFLFFRSNPKQSPATKVFFIILPLFSLKP